MVGRRGRPQLQQEPQLLAASAWITPALVSQPLAEAPPRAWRKPGLPARAPAAGTQQPRIEKVEITAESPALTLHQGQKAETLKYS